MAHSYYIKTPNPGMAGGYKDAAELSPAVNRSLLVRLCKTCQVRHFKGPFWWHECSSCNPELEGKHDRSKAYERERKARQRAAKQRELDKLSATHVG